MSSSNYSFLTCIQISQEAGQAGHLFKNSPEFVVVHRVKGFGIVNKAEIDVFLELSCFFNDPKDTFYLHCILVLINIPFCRCITHSPTEGHFGCFQFLTMMNKIAINLREQIMV